MNRKSYVDVYEYSATIKLSDGVWTVESVTQPNISGATTTIAIDRYIEFLETVKGRLLNLQSKGD